MKSKLSKALVLLLSLAMMAAQFVVPTFAADYGLCECETHAEDDAIKSSVPATCAHYGYIVKQCQRDECQGLYYEFIPATGEHTWEHHDPQDPTCLEGGWDAYDVCTVCGKETEHEVYTALGHDYQPVTTDPTCTEKGYTTYTCTRCGDTYEADYVDALGHDYEAIVTPPTCTEKGYTTHTCAICGDSFRDTEVDALGHDYEYEKVDDCESATSVICTCKVCGYSFAQSKEPGEHIVKTDPAIPATCIASGLTEGSHCEACGKVLVAQEVIPVDPEAHVPTVSKQGQFATCTDEGVSDELACSECGKVLLEQIVLEKNDNHLIVHHEAKAPNCTEVGWEAYDTCGREGCNYTTYVEIPANGHNWENKDGKAATCEEAGYTAYQECSVCHEIQNKDVIPALGHETNSTLGEVAPTCTQTGLIISYCERCNTIISTVLDPLGHKEVEHEAKAATCTEDGWEAYVTCERCDYSTQKIISALGHDYQAVVTDPTCTEHGYTTHTCSRCDDEYVDTYVDALGHTEVIDEADAPTYDTEGKTEGKHCSVCGEVLVAQDEIPMKKENITFTYEATGIKDSTVAVNSGDITLNVYLNVNSEIARLYGAQLGIDFTNLFTDGEGNLKNALTLTKVEGSLLDTAGSTDLVTANNNKKVVLAQDMGINGGAAKVLEEGKYLFATLTFKVNSDFYGDAVSFDVVDENCRVSRNLANIMEADFGEGAELDVIQLGDANEDGVIDSLDMLDLAIWYDAADLDSYETVYDLDKNGEINGDDFALLRGAIVGNNG